MRRVLTCRGLVYLGQRSYGAYLLHVLPIHLGYMVFGSATLAAGLLTDLLYARSNDPGSGIAASDRRAPRRGSRAASDEA